MGNSASGEAGGGPTVDIIEKVSAIRPKGTILFDGHDEEIDSRKDKLAVKTKSLAHRRELAANLRKCFVFESMGDEELAAVVDAFSKKGVPAREFCIAKGSVGETFFVVHEGTFRNIIDGTEVGEFHKGDSFGELSLLHTTRRDVGVMAVEDPCSVWTIDRDVFRKTLAIHHQSKRRKLAKWFQKVPLLSKLKPGELMNLVDSVRTANYSAGQRVVKAGEKQMTFFMIQSGKLRAGSRSQGQGTSSVDGAESEEYESGQFFGEMALVGGHVVEKDVNAVGQSTLLALDVATFEAVLGPYMKLLEAHYNVAVLSQVPSLSKLTHAELKRLNTCLTPERFQRGATLVKRGEVLSKLVFFLSGEALVEGPGVAGKDKRDPYQQIEEPWDSDRKVLQAGDFFAQMSLLSDEIAAYSVTVGDEPVDAMCLHRKDVTALFGPLHRLIIQRDESKPRENEFDDDEGLDLRRLEIRQHWTVREQPDVAFEELRSVATLRSGTFGDLRLVVHKPMGTVFALKSFSRPQLKRTGGELLPKREKAALSLVGAHPFCIKLVNTYKNPKKLYMLLEHVPGGELYHRIHPPPIAGSVALNKDAHMHGLGSEADASFYAACVVLALGYMHSREVVYRNLCAESVLIDSEGYIRLIDFETAKVVGQGEHTHTLCGTPEYMCPEMLLGKGHREGADWWALGILIHEMLTAHTPFEDVPHRREDVVMKNIVRHNLLIPPQLSSEAADLVTKLLAPDQPERLGCQRSGSLDVQEHAWFKKNSVDFLAVGSMHAKPPFTPVLMHRSDCSHFPAAEQVA